MDRHIMGNKFLTGEDGNDIDLKEKKLIIFDLDGTLNESKCPIDRQMAEILGNLLEKKKVAVISGSGYKVYLKNIVEPTEGLDMKFDNLFLFPTCSTRFYHYENKDWKEVYAEELTEDQKEKIKDAFDKMYSELNYVHPQEITGEILEDRGTQITFSAYGQKAPYELKKIWDPDFEKRKKMQAVLEKYLPDLDVRLGGTTSIDVTKKGIDKAYGIKKIEEHIGIQKNEMLFIGDAIFEGGNDYPVLKTGVDSIQIKDAEETKQVVKKIIEES